MGFMDMYGQLWPTNRGLFVGSCGSFKAFEGPQQLYVVVQMAPAFAAPVVWLLAGNAVENGGRWLEGPETNTYQIRD